MSAELSIWMTIIVQTTPMVVTGIDITCIVGYAHAYLRRPLLRQAFWNILIIYFLYDRKMASTMKNLYYDVLKWKLCYEQPSSNERNFLMCKSCFWCASSLSSMYRSLKACPSCMNSELEFMPISSDERYIFDYDTRHGVTLEFCNNDGIR